MRLRLEYLFLLSTIAVSACSDWLPHGVGFGLNRLPDRRCDRALDPSLAPEAAERHSFYARFEGGMVVAPIRVSCVVKAYSQAELLAWADAGDPVAAYAVAYSIARKGKSVCDGANEKKAYLLRSLGPVSDRRIWDGQSAYVPVRRVPEAADAIRQINETCRVLRDATQVEPLSAYGYDALYGVEE